VAELRARAFTVFARAWEECRRAVTYLRWHEGDADKLVPSLRSNKGPRRRGASAAGAPPAAPAGG
jgi:hypothetical protein